MCSFVHYFLFPTDHYIIVGASRNSFSIGEDGGIPGTAMLLEFAKNLQMIIKRDKWHPKRTIRLISWGGAEFGNIGMNEFLQVRGKILAIFQYIPYFEIT